MEIDWVVVLDESNEDQYDQPDEWIDYSEED